MSDLNREIVYIAGLLHDIGKFYQRADVFYESSTKLASNSKLIADYICPKGKNGLPAYQHVIWTHDFFENAIVSKKLKQLGLSSNLGIKEGQEDTLQNLSCYHHNPQTLFQAFIQVADWWSSGMDRNARYEADETVFKEYKNFREVRLVSIFEQLGVENKNVNEQQHSLPLQALNISRSCFPEQTADYQQMDYEKLWENFIKEFEAIPVHEGNDNRRLAIEAFNESLLFLIRKYAWCVPSSAHKKDLPDVNLHDHLRTTGAIAQCLYDYWTEQKDDFELQQLAGKKRLVIKDGCHPLLFFCGDISGIQKYIYDIYSSKAAKSLKGRSFFLQLLVESLVQRIITQCGVTTGHVVYASGGKFYMLLPNTAKVREELHKLELETAENIYNGYHGALYVCMDYLPFCYQFNKGRSEISILNDPEKPTKTDNLGELWRQLSEKTSLKKQQKFKHLMLDRFEHFFHPDNVGAMDEVCAVTGQFFEGKDDRVEIDKDEEGNPVYVKSNVYDQVKLGEALKDADYFLTFRSSESARDLKIPSFEPLKLDVRHHLFDSQNLAYDDADFRKISSVDTARVRRINETNFNLINTLKGNRTSYGFTFYGGNQQARKKNDSGSWINKTFEELAQYGNGKKTRLGILRMDVDNLGKLFIHGIPDDKRNLSRYATLSSQLDWFFSGYLNTIRDSSFILLPASHADYEQYPEHKAFYRDWVNILYSGGDDVFAVGRWDMLIAFAEQIRNDFRDFVCGREEISISAGIAMVDPKFPIAKGAELAGEAEEKAKSFSTDGVLPSKNAFCFFGEAISWHKEFAEVKSLKEEMVYLVHQEGLSNGLLQKLMQFQQMKNHVAQDQSKSYIWNSTYYLARYAERFKNQAAHPVKLFLDELKNKLFTGGGFPPHERYFDLAALAARWAEYELKSN